MKKIINKAGSLGINQLLVPVLFLSLLIPALLVFADNIPSCNATCAQACTVGDDCPCGGGKNENNHESDVTCVGCSGTGCDAKDPSNHVGTPTCSTPCSGSGCSEKDPSNHETQGAMCDNKCDCGWGPHHKDLANEHCTVSCACGDSGEMHRGDPCEECGGFGDCSYPDCGSAGYCSACGGCGDHCGGHENEGGGDPDDFNIYFDSSSESLANSYSLNEFAGSEHRKISVSGRPVPDSKPQRNGETDYNREETYVDALTLDLRHEVTDIFVPLASEQLALSVRRNLMQATYGVEEGDFEDPNSGLFNASQAFGACWSSGLDCGLQIVTAYSYDDSTGTVSVDAGYRTVALVTDENGQTYRFGILDDGTFLPLPTTSVSIDVANLSLTQTNNTYVFTRRYGNTIVFDGEFTVEEGSGKIERSVVSGGAVVITISGSDGVEWIFGVSTNNTSQVVRWNSAFSGSESCYPREDYERRERYRPQYVEDRYGNRLKYSFSGSNLVPSQIKALNNMQATSDLVISISLNANGNVGSVTDPKGNNISYSYTRSSNNDFATNGLALLTRAIRNSSISTTYRYTESTNNKYVGQYSWTYTVVEAPENDDSGSGNFNIDYHHVVLRSVEDANSNRYDFEWMTNQSACTLEYWDGTYSSDPGNTDQAQKLSFEELLTNTAISWVVDTNRAAHSLQIASITHDGETATFNVDSVFQMTSPALPPTVSSRQTSVADMGGNSWTYSFSDSSIRRSLDRPFLGTIENEGISANRSDAVLFKTMSITAQNNGCETFYFDPNAGMALRKSVDRCGNETLFDHADDADYSGLGESEQALRQKTHLAHKLRRPTKQTDELSQEREYTYEASYNQKESITNELGVVTTFEFDTLGNRTNMVKKAPNGTVLSLTEMEYTSGAFPNFMTRQTVKKISGRGNPDWATNLVTAFEPHAYGQVGRKIVDPGRLNLMTIYGYDRNNNLTSVIDPNGNKVVHLYDARNRLTEIRFYEGVNTLRNSKKFWYDARGNKTWERDESNHYSHFEYDSRNNCIKTVRIMDGTSTPAAGYTAHADDISVSSEYNALSLLTATVDARGLRTEFDYDSLGRLTQSTVGANLSSNEWLVTSYEYGANSGSFVFSSDGFKPTRVTDPRGFITITVYDSLYRPVQIKAEIRNGVYAETRNIYDAVGNLEEVRNRINGSDWQTTSTYYDYLNRPEYVEYPDSTWMYTYYTTTGLKRMTEDYEERQTRVEYDAAGRPVKTISPALTSGIHAEIEMAYDANGNVQSIVDANDNISANVYDFRNRLAQTIAPFVWDAENSVSNHPVVSTLYDAVGNVVSVTDAEGNTTTNFYDNNNRLIKTRAPEVPIYESAASRPVTSNFYDKAGNIIATVDANGRTVQMQYDAFGRLTNTIDAIGNTISFEYDKNGSQTALIDGKGNCTEFVYDGLNRKTVTRYPDLNEESVAYDLIGNRVQRTDGRGQTTDYEYDSRNRLTNVTYAGSSRTREYQYDLAGNLEEVIESADTNANVSYRYDNLNRVIRETSVGVSHQYDYDLNGNRTQAIYGVTGRTNSWNYDALNRIAQIIDGTNVTSYGYDLNGNPVQRIYPTGVEENRYFDAMNRLDDVVTFFTPEWNEYFYMDYTYDAVGSARRMDQGSYGLDGKAQDALTEWTYDDRYRLTNETVVTMNGSTNITNSTVYAWDAADNRLYMKKYASGYNKKTSNTTVRRIEEIDYQVNDLNQVTWLRVDHGNPIDEVTEFEYDANGNRTNKSIRSSDYVPLRNIYYVYDEDNRLVVVLDGDYDTTPIVCRDCQGSGECSKCDSNGNCIDCGGGGILPCSSCEDSGICTNCVGVDCVDCNSSGVCSDCAAASPCAVCNGSGNCPDDCFLRLCMTCVSSGDEYLPLPAETNRFAYDYRSRRFYRATPTETNLCVFDGGLTVQEYNVSQASSLPSVSTLSTEFVRGEGMGGGVGGMVYSITTNGIICSHANHRGDVIARTDMNGNLTSFALYEAYGTRPYEWPADGSGDPDRFKANTKEEEKDLGLLNEGFRYRDLETGTFLTRDPIGYADGPNIYCYVHCNPITYFDAYGLETARIRTSSSFLSSTWVQYPTKGEPAYDRSCFVENGKPMVTSRISKTVVGKTVLSSEMKPRSANMNSLEGRYFKTEGGQLVARSVDAGNQVNLKGPDLQTFSRDVGSNYAPLEMVANISVEATMSVMPVPTEGKAMLVKMLYEGVKGMATSAAQQKIDNGQISKQEMITAGLESIASLGVSEKISALRVDESFIGDALQKAAEILVDKGLDLALPEISEEEIDVPEPEIVEPDIPDTSDYER